MHVCDELTLFHWFPYLIWDFQQPYTSSKLHFGPSSQYYSMDSKTDEKATVTSTSSEEKVPLGSKRCQLREIWLQVQLLRKACAKICVLQRRSAGKALCLASPQCRDEYNLQYSIMHNMSTSRIWTTTLMLTVSAAMAVWNQIWRLPYLDPA